MANSGLYNEVIEILTLTEQAGEFGDMVSTWSGGKKTRARVTFANGKRENQNDEIVNTYSPVFYLRHYHKINEATNRIRYKGVIYRIISAPPVDRERRELVIVAEKIIE